LAETHFQLFLLNPTQVGFRALAVVSTARQLVIRGPNLSPRNQPAVETTAGLQNPTSLGLEEKS